MPRDCTGVRSNTISSGGCIPLIPRGLNALGVK